ncbi:MAG TPA: translation initiation factor IF-2 subunit gamma [Methanocorpusculum sp.]|nr:translation initiation factor IF-2 subunit gamma [Methanocorpusculum sp.]
MHNHVFPNINIGVVGHVDHGKTTLVGQLTGSWTDRHSEELKRGISIRLGYADAVFYHCDKCNCPESWSTTNICPVCGKKIEPVRAVSFVDAPGHETLMATMLSGSAIMDGAMLVISANEPCPQPQTKEHLMALELTGIKNIVIVQNKIDVVSQQQAIDNYNQIKKFIKNTVAENAPIIPVSAQKKINFGVLIDALNTVIPDVERDVKANPIMLIARSFDVNLPGTPCKDVKGGVIGGSLIYGEFHEGDSIEIRPGRQYVSENKVRWKPITTKITSINKASRKISVATPGGLSAICTKLDPAITKSDTLVGQVVGMEGLLPPVKDKLKLDLKLMDRIVGAVSEQRIEPLRLKEPLMLSVGTAITVGIVTSAKKNKMEVDLKRPVCVEVGSHIAISRQVNGRWRLIGMGVIID